MKNLLRKLFGKKVNSQEETKNKTKNETPVEPSTSSVEKHEKVEEYLSTNYTVKNALVEMGKMKTQKDIDAFIKGDTRKGVLSKANKILKADNTPKASTPAR